MASSFHIHVDCENDNPIKEIKNDIKNNLNKDKQQRSTFSILNYQANGTRTAHVPQKTVGKILTLKPFYLLISIFFFIVRYWVI